MARLSKDKLDSLKLKYNVDRIWSYSRINTYKNLNGWEYYIKYILKKPLNTENIWTYFGTYAHDIIQDYIEGKYPQEHMIELFDGAIDNWQLNRSDLKFPDEKIQDGYINNMRRYFTTVNYDDIQDKHKVIEMPVIINFKTDDDKNIVFVGYVDLIYRDEDKFYIVDFKTSSKSSFSGQKLKDSSMQLKLYAIGIHQMQNIDYDNIVLRYDMQKYVNVSYKQKNGNWSKPSLKERKDWIFSQFNRISTLLQDNGVDMFTAEELINDAIKKDSLEDLPEYVRERFRITKGFIDIEMNEEIAKETEKEIIETVQEIMTRENADNLEAEFPEPILEYESFYLYNLAPGLLEYHKEYQDKRALKEALNNEGSLDILDDLFA